MTCICDKTTAEWVKNSADPDQMQHLCIIYTFLFDYNTVVYMYLEK